MQASELPDYSMCYNCYHLNLKLTNCLHFILITQLTKGMSATRSTSASTKVAKKVARIFNLPPRYWEGDVDRSQIPELTELFTVSLAMGFPPVLYADFKPKPKNFLLFDLLAMVMSYPISHRHYLLTQSESRLAE